MLKIKVAFKVTVALILCIGFFGSAQSAFASPPNLYWHWTKLKIKQSDCGKRAYKVLSSSIRNPKRKGTDTVWARNSSVNTTIQCIKLGKNKSLAVMIVTSMNSREAKGTRDYLKCGMAGNPLNGRRGCGEG